MIRGDIVAFKGEGFTFELLSFLLGIFEKDWRELTWKPWHLAIAWEKGHKGWYILEATGKGVEINFYFDAWLSKNTRHYKWLDTLPPKDKMGGFLVEVLGTKYDVLLYPWTALQYLVRHYINHRIPRLLDCRFTCWELVTEFCEYMGKPVISKYDCPLISDILRNFKNP